MGIKELLRRVGKLEESEVPPVDVLGEVTDQEWTDLATFVHGVRADSGVHPDAPITDAEWAELQRRGPDDASGGPTVTKSNHEIGDQR